MISFETIHELKNIIQFMNENIIIHERDFLVHESFPMFRFMIKNVDHERINFRSSKMFPFMNENLVHGISHEWKVFTNENLVHRISHEWKVMKISFMDSSHE